MTDKISPYDEACQLSSPPMTMKEFKEQCKAIIKGELYDERLGHSSAPINERENAKEGDGIEEDDDTEELLKRIGVDAETLMDLREVCSIDNLKCEYEDVYDYNKARVYLDYPEDNPLHLIRMAKNEKTKSENLTYVPNFFEPPEVEVEIPTGSELIAEDEVILNIHLFHPKKTKTVQHVLVLEDTKLSEFKDLILCRMDNFIFGEYSNNPDLTGTKESKEIYPSATIFIESCFYNDTRNPLNIDYSKVIIDWAKSSERLTVPGLGLFESKVMEDTTFGDLSIRLGFPYMYCHQGDCEHLLVITDMRMRKDTDPKYRSSYPYNAEENLARRRKCSICFIHLAKWMTLNDALTFEDPGFFCEKCFRFLHYTEDGKKIQAFEAYPYVEGD